MTKMQVSSKKDYRYLGTIIEIGFFWLLLNPAWLYQPEKFRSDRSVVCRKYISLKIWRGFTGCHTINKCACFVSSPVQPVTALYDLHIADSKLYQYHDISCHSAPHFWPRKKIQVEICALQPLITTSLPFPYKWAMQAHPLGPPSHPIIGFFSGWEINGIDLARTKKWQFTHHAAACGR